MTLSVRGLSSGLDINGIIEELMNVERMPIRRKEVQIERTEQIGNLWREVNSALDTLKRTMPPLQNRLTYTAPVPVSGNEEVLKAIVSGMPSRGSHRFNVSQMATNHSIAMNPPSVGERISSTDTALGREGTFYLGTGRQPEGIDSLVFDSGNSSWLRGNFGAGFQAVVNGQAESLYTLSPTELVFTDTSGIEGGVNEFEGAGKIKVYLSDFSLAAGGDGKEALEAYFAEKGWGGIDLENEPLFTLQGDGNGGWEAVGQNGDEFAFLGDHPLGTFNLRGEIVNDQDEVVAVNNFDFHIRDSVDETGFISIKESDSLLVIADKINNKSAETGVSASVVKANEGDYRLVLESAFEGREGFIQAFDYSPLNSAGETKYGTDAVLAGLNLLTGSSASGPSYALEPQEALDAQFTLNGLQMTRSSNNFTDVIDGLEVSLKGIGSSTLDVAPDIDAAVEEISLFVQAFNEVNSFLRRLQQEDEGPLQGSSDLMRMERQLRTLIHGQVPDLPGSSHLRDSLAYSGSGGVSAAASGSYTGTAQKIELIYNSSNNTWRHDGRNFNSGDEIHGVAISINPSGTPANNDTLVLNVSPPSEPLEYRSLSSIGIMSNDKEGILQVNDAKLREALSADAEGIFKLFAREAPTDASGRKTGADGLGVQMDSLLKNLIGPSGLVENRQNSLQREIRQYQDRIEMLENRMEMREQRLIRQFTFMEQYIARIQEQTGLMSSFEAMMQSQRE